MIRCEAKKGLASPCIGGGIAVTSWKYSEVGDFIDFNDNNNVYHAQYLSLIHI